MPQVPPTDVLPVPVSYNPQQLRDVASLIHNPAHPQQIGPYRIVEPIGQGGMGVVYRAEQQQPIQRTVAVKVIKLGMDTVEFIARFESERQALALMNHPNVARVFDAAATETGRPYLVMEYVSGEPITMFCDRHHLDTHQRLELFTQACEAVQHAHQKAIIHRDLKPSNILVTLVDGKAQVKVIDFGVAKAVNDRLTEQSYFTETGRLVGTPEYMSPEQADANGADIDTRTDIYSLGVVLYELLSGMLPMDPLTLRSAAYGEIQRIIREVEPPRPSTRLSSLGEDIAEEVARHRRTQVESLTRELRSELEWIPLKAMRKDRAHRYRTAVELAEDIRSYLASEPLRAGPESAVYRLRKFVRRNRRGVVVTLGMLMLIVAGTAATGWQAVRATRAEFATRSALNQLRISADANRAINDFLTDDILHAAVPAVSRGEQRTIKQAVDDAAKTIEAKFKNQPLVAASIRNTLGITYDGLGRADLGLPHAQWALQQRRALLGNDHPDTIGAMNNVVTLLESLSQIDQAEPLAKEAVDRARGAAGIDPRTRITALSNLGHLRHAQGRIAEAESFYRAALADCRGALGEADPEILTALANVASMLLDQRRPAEAEALFRELIARQRQVLPNPDEHPDTISAISNLAMALQQQKKYEEAERLDRQALAVARRVLHDDHPLTLVQMQNLADVCLDLGKLEEAETLLREELATARRRLPADHPQTLGAMNNLAAVLDERGRTEEAVPLYRDVVDRCRKSLGDTHPYTIMSLNNLAKALTSLNRFDQAEPLWAEVYERVADAEMDPKQKAAVMAGWGLCLVELGQYAKAEAPLRAAKQKAHAAGLDNKAVMVKLLRALATVCEHTNRRDEAARYRDEAARIVSAATGTASRRPPPPTTSGNR